MAKSTETGAQHPGWARGNDGDDFEEGEANGARDALNLTAAIVETLNTTAPA